MQPKIPRVLLILCLIAGCSNHHPSGTAQIHPMSDWEIYRRIHLGMSQSKVETLVGKPHAPVSHGLALYGKPPVAEFDPHGSRAMPFNVIVVYSNKVAVSKELYSGHDVYIEGVCPFPFGDDNRGTPKSSQRGKVAK